jgi:hypothetical protein
MNTSTISTNAMTGGAMTVMSTVQTIFTFFFICINGWILYYLNHMRSACTHCAEEWKIPLIMVALFALLLYIILSIFQKMPAYMNIVFFVLWSIFVALTLKLVYEIRGTKCKCAKERNITLLEQFMYINAFLLIVVFLMASVLSSSSKTSPKFFNGGSSMNTSHNCTNITK